MATKNIIIRRREQDSLKGMYRYCEIIGTRWFNRCKLPWKKRLAKGELFNVYRIEYEEDGKGNVKRWLCENKYGCEYNGVSIESSLSDLDKYINDNDFLRRELVPGELGPYRYLKPLGLFLFDRKHFTENEAGVVTREQAMILAESTTKDERTVWHYNLDCSTFDSDYEAGSIDFKKYWVRTM